MDGWVEEVQVTGVVLGTNINPWLIKGKATLLITPTFIIWVHACCSQNRLDILVISLKLYQYLENI